MYVLASYRYASKWATHAVYLDNETTIAKSIHDLVVMQFTGVKDSFGFELYEDDLVIFNGVINRIVYEDDFARFSLMHYDGDGGIDLLCGIDPGDKLTLVGNVYENPEMLPDRE